MQFCQKLRTTQDSTELEVIILCWTSSAPPISGNVLRGFLDHSDVEAFVHAQLSYGPATAFQSG